MNLNSQDRKFLVGVIVGDIVALFLATVIGFASHGSLDSAGTRFFSTFLPLILGWFAIAPFLGLFDLNDISSYKQLWRPLYVMLVSAPLAGWIRGVMLNSPVLPLFVLILGLSTALIMLIWRLVALIIVNKFRN